MLLRNVGTFLPVHAAIDPKDLNLYQQTLCENLKSRLVMSCGVKNVISTVTAVPFLLLHTGTNFLFNM